MYNHILRNWVNRLQHMNFGNTVQPRTLVPPAPFPPDHGQQPSLLAEVSDAVGESRKKCLASLWGDGGGPAILSSTLLRRPTFPSCHLKPSPLPTPPSRGSCPSGSASIPRAMILVSLSVGSLGYILVYTAYLSSHPSSPPGTF